nr:MAG TPA: hypothetical protein [Caudoviricetes sp.]
MLQLYKRTEFDIRKLSWLICVYHYRCLTIVPLWHTA